MTALVFVSGVAAGSAQAESAGITFSGVVPSKGPGGRVAEYPATLVSFSDQVALPVQGLGSRTDSYRVYAEDGRAVAIASTVQLTVSNQTLSVPVVALDDRSRQVFVACSQSRNHCMRYHVARY